MSQKIGFIGCGNMGSAIILGGLKADVLHKKNLLVSEMNADKCQQLREVNHIRTCSNVEVVRASDIIVLAIKPNMYEEVLNEIKTDFSDDKVLVSIGAGVSINYLKQQLNNDDLKVVRVMPNTPALVSAGMSGLCPNNVDEKTFDYVRKIFDGLGKTVIVSETQMDAVTALSGSGPAYGFMFIDAMVESAIKMGLKPEDARIMAAQTLLGAAKMVLDSDVDVKQLKINVCSPGGTTIEAVEVFENRGLYEIVDEAMQACAAKSAKISK